jgi:hypothetical protein
MDRIQIRIRILKVRICIWGFGSAQKSSAGHFLSQIHLSLILFFLCLPVFMYNPGSNISILHTS